MNSTTAALPIAKRMRAMGFWVIRGTITQRRYWILAAVGLLLPLIGWGDPVRDRHRQSGVPPWSRKRARAHRHLVQQR